MSAAELQSVDFPHLSLRHRPNTFVNPLPWGLGSSSWPVREGPQALEAVREGEGPLEGSEPLEAVREGSVPLEPVCEGPEPLEAVCEGEGPLEAVREGSEPLEAVCEGSEPLEAICEDSGPVEAGGGGSSLSMDAGAALPAALFPLVKQRPSRKRSWGSEAPVPDVVGQWPCAPC